jgi:AraC-like DNA-binding protein
MTEPKRPQALQRAAALLLLPPLLTELGISPDAVLGGTGVAPDQLRPDAYIPYAAFLSILDNASRLSGRDDIGMQLGMRQTLAALGPLGEVIRHAATLNEALGDFTAFQAGNSTGGAVYLLRADGSVILGYGVYDASSLVSPQIYDLVLAIGCNLIAELTGGAGMPEEILLSRAAPADPAPWLRLAPCPVRFGQNQTGLRLRNTTLDLTLPAANAMLHDQALASLLSGPGGSPPAISARVRHLLRPMLLNGQAGMEDVASRLSLHARALRRRLVEEGTTFAALKDEVRFAIARELLLLGPLDLTDIAITLDCASASSFVHSFRRWSGQSPGEWRSQQRGSALISASAGPPSRNGRPG